ncbi:PGF-CTERM sorting domain-containing protein [Methanosarcina horonobensis]
MCTISGEGSEAGVSREGSEAGQENEQNESLRTPGFEVIFGVAGVLAVFLYKKSKKP